MAKIYDVIVVGGGPAGYTAAMYGARAGLDVLVLEKLSAGGQMAETTLVENYPGFPDGVDGFELGQQMQQQAEKFGAVSEIAQLVSAELDGSVKHLVTDSGEFSSRAVILATGAGPRKLDIPGEEKGGVHYCAACDGMRYRGKTVMVVGGGNSAVHEALQLSRIASKVILVHRRDSLRADKVYHQALLDAPNIEFMWDSAVSALHHEGKLTGVSVKNLKNNDEAFVPCDGVFVSIGRKPDTEIFRGQLELDRSGYIVAGEDTRASLPGVFAAGDMRTKALRQIITAASDGAVAAHYAGEYIAKGE